MENEQKAITQKLQAIKKPPTFDDQQWTAVCKLNNTMREIEADYRRQGRIEFPHLTFEVLHAF